MAQYALIEEVIGTVSHRIERHHPAQVDRNRPASHFLSRLQNAVPIVCLVFSSQYRLISHKVPSRERTRLARAGTRCRLRNNLVLIGRPLGSSCPVFQCTSNCHTRPSVRRAKIPPKVKAPASRKLVPDLSGMKARSPAIDAFVGDGTPTPERAVAFQKADRWCGTARGCRQLVRCHIAAFARRPFVSCRLF